MVQMLDEFRDVEFRNGDRGLRSPKVHDQDRCPVNGSSDCSMLQKAMKYRLQRLEMENGSLEEGDSFFVVDLGYVDRQYKLWSQKIPRALPCYAVKCNPDLPVINFLASLGAGFDCASSTEMQLVLSQGIAPERIIFSNSCKMQKDLRFARAHKIRRTTFDNLDELYKIKRIYPEAQLYIRISASDVQAKYNLSEKFGASEESAPKLLQFAKKLSLNVIGVSFHVGSGAVDSQAFENAIHQSKILFEHGRILGFKMQSLDIGGGFSEGTFPAFSAQVTRSLDNHFPTDIEIVAEPGRFFAENAMTLACNVIARRSATDPAAEGAFEMLYLNDGLYGNFMAYAFEQPAPTPQVLYGEGEYFPDEVGGGNNKDPSTYFVWGPTCDGCDFINKRIKLRSGLKIGDWLYYNNMGAYSSALATNFNGFLNQRNAVYIGTTSAARSFLRDRKSLIDDSRSSVYLPIT